MKKFVVLVATVVGLLATSATPALANVIHANGSTGVPAAVGSNAGSMQGQTHRSATGTQNKEAHDGWMFFD